jgi:uncharacterized membrane protein YozB (DUF420 family)
MAGLLGPSGPQINFVLQIVTFLILIAGYLYKRQRRYKAHGSLMGTAVILHIISYITVMGPIFFGNIDLLLNSLSFLEVQTTMIHAIPGAVALILGIILVAAWAVNTTNIGGCIRRKRIMDITIILWLLSLIFGIATYLLIY